MLLSNAKQHHSRNTLVSMALTSSVRHLQMFSEVLNTLLILNLATTRVHHRRELSSIKKTSRAGYSYSPTVVCFPALFDEMRSPESAFDLAHRQSQK